MSSIKVATYKVWQSCAGCLSVLAKLNTVNYLSGCQSTGGHYNPFNKTHGGPQDQIR